MFTRRQFLEDSILAATAALAGPALVASAAEPKKPSANERLSVAVIGTGIRGPVHAGAFAGRGDCDVVAICDADSSRAQRHADSVGKRQNRKVAAYQDLRKIIDDKSIDCVSTSKRPGLPWAPGSSSIRTKSSLSTTRRPTPCSRASIADRSSCRRSAKSDARPTPANITAIQLPGDTDDGTYPQVIKENLPLLKDTRVVLIPSVGSRKKMDRKDPKAVEMAVKILRETSDDAKKYGLGGVAPYMHIGNWIETIDENLRIAKAVDRRNVAVMFHLHHWQAVGNPKPGSPHVP